MDGIVGKVKINALLLQTILYYVEMGSCSNGWHNLQKKEVCININDDSSEDSGQYFGKLVVYKH